MGSIFFHLKVAPIRIEPNFKIGEGIPKESILQYF